MNYEKYVSTQIEGNIRKFDRSGVADDWLVRLHPIVEEIQNHLKVDHSKNIFGVCMGARNGAEVFAFQKLLKSYHQVTVVGTDISPTASNLSNMVVHDFHNPLPSTFKKADFIYSNSLDQANNPKQALESWLASLDPNGAIFLEMQRGHGKQSTSLLDPFSCETEIFPFVFLSWNLKGYIKKLLHPKIDDQTYAIFVIKPLMQN